MKKNRVIIMAIKPKYAEAIYAGKKRWEFRKAPPPVPGWVLLYESAPVSAITGKVFLGAKIQGEPSVVWGFAKTQKTIGGSVRSNDRMAKWFKVLVPYYRRNAPHHRKKVAKDRNIQWLRSAKKSASS